MTENDMSTEVEMDEGSATRIDTPRAAGQPLPVLVVSARPELMATVTAKLRELNHLLVTAPTAEAAQRHVLGQHFSGILVDARMAWHRGQTLLRYRNEWNTDIAAILIGDRADEDPGSGGAQIETSSLDRDPATLAALGRALEESRSQSAERRLVRRATRLLSVDPRDASSADEVVTPPVAALRELDAHLLSDSPASRIDRIVAACGPLAAGIVRLANRVDDGGTGPRYAGLRAVINWLGLARLQQLADIVAAREAFPVRGPALGALADQIWLHGVARSAAMQELADCPAVPPRWWFGDISRAGLFADAGAQMILWMTDQAAGPAGAADGAIEPTLRLIAEHHEWMGEDLVRRWGMTDEIAALAGNHHRRPNRMHLPFWPIGLAASDIADEVVDSAERPPAGASPSVGEALDILRVGAAERRQLTEIVRARVAWAREALIAAPTSEPEVIRTLRSVP